MKSLRWFLAVFMSAVLIGSAVVGTSSTVDAAKPSAVPGAHFKNGEEPDCTFEGDTVICEGTIVGLGGQDVQIFLDAPVLVTVTCRNPANQDNPSQRTFGDTAEGVANFPNASNNLEFLVSAQEPDVAATCKRNWIGTAESSFTGEWTVTVCVNGQVVLSDQSSASAPRPSCG